MPKVFATLFRVSGIYGVHSVRTPVREVAEL